MAESNKRTWLVPTEASDVDMAFPARGADPDFLPAWEDIPEIFKMDNEYTRVADHWFSQGLGGKELEATDVDPGHAYRHLRMVLGCFGSKHEHKIAAAGYLISLWFRLPEKTHAGPGTRY